MKKAAITMAGLILVAAMGVSNAWADRIEKRQHTQKDRIQMGIHDRTLTRVESRALVKEQQAIRRAIRKAWADGRLTPMERLRIEKMLDRADLHIRRLKHHLRASR
jgi:uncharacterized membrane protein YebE (DUF533 family)